MMFNTTKQKLVKDYSFLTTILLLFLSISIYLVSIHLSYKDQLRRLELLAIEECEELYYKINDNDTSNLIEPDDNDKYFNTIIVYAYDKNKQLVFSHNEIDWSQQFFKDNISNNKFLYHHPYFYCTLIDNRHPKIAIALRYPLIENNQYLGEVYVGFNITHWVREQLRILLFILIIIFLSMFFVRYVAYKMANKAMIPIMESLAQQKQFIANASHELRTPLSIILSGLAVLKADTDNKLSKFSQVVTEDIHDESLRMKKLIDDLLLTARNDNHTLSVNPTTFNLSEIITKIYTKFSLLAKEKCIQLKLDNLSDIYITADVTHIKQILSILIDNAIKYTKNNGIVSIIVTKQKNTINIAIKDTGLGINSDNLPHIFEPFYRADKARTYHGNGLGLSIAKILANKNNSDIIVSSKEHHGSCFTLIIKN